MDTDIIIPKKIEDQLYFLKPVLTLDEACRYTGLSKSMMYKHTSAGNIAFYKPEHKLIYFRRVDLDFWLLRNRKASNEEIERMAMKDRL